MKTMFEILIKFLGNLHSALYLIIGRLAIYLEGGLHPKHRIMNYHKFFVNNINEVDTVLDIGCGNGALAYDLAKKVREVLAIDVNRKNIEIAKKRYNAENIQYVIGNVINYDFKQKFDVAILSNVLEHIDKRIGFLTQIKKGITGKFLVRVPMVNRDWLTLYKKELGIDYRLDKTHFTEYTLDSFRKEIESAGLIILKHYVCFGELYAVLGING